MKGQFNCPICGRAMRCKQMNRKGPAKPPGYFGLCVVPDDHSCKVMAYKLEPGEGGYNVVRAETPSLGTKLIGAEEDFVRETVIEGVEELSLSYRVAGELKDTWSSYALLPEAVTVSLSVGGRRCCALLWVPVGLGGSASEPGKTP